MAECAIAFYLICISILEVLRLNMYLFNTVYLKVDNLWQWYHFFEIFWWKIVAACEREEAIEFYAIPLIILQSQKEQTRTKVKNNKRVESLSKKRRSTLICRYQNSKGYRLEGLCCLIIMPSLNMFSCFLVSCDI